MDKLIYFVDDDKMILNLLEYTFSSRDGYTVQSFRSGEKLLEELDAKPDLIVLDHSFLVENSAYSSGLEILKKIRERHSDVKVIVLSGQNNEKLVNDYKENGVNTFINKDSFFIDSLIESIEKAFS